LTCFFGTSTAKDYITTVWTAIYVRNFFFLAWRLGPYKFPVSPRQTVENALFFKLKIQYLCDYCRGQKEVILLLLFSHFVHTFCSLVFCNEAHSAFCEVGTGL
jgi:hypothetical protein